MAEFLRLKKSNCKNCYKCIRNCPVKSIRFSDGQANIASDECILCGQCFVVCPQNAKEIVSDVDRVKAMLAGGAPVVASIAPSFIANYAGVGIAGLESALKKLGLCCGGRDRTRRNHGQEGVRAPARRRSSGYPDFLLLPQRKPADPEIFSG